MKLFKTINLNKLKIFQKQKIVGSLADFNSKKDGVIDKRRKTKSPSISYLVFSKRALLLFLSFITILSGFAFLPSVFATTPRGGLLTVVIDAGHGGIDGGCVGTLEGSNERELNLLYANTLKRYLEEYGIRVVMTRTTTDGLYSSFSTNRKKDDMAKRKEIIENAKPDVIISIHMNSFPLKSSRGAHVFYNPDREVSKKLGESIQSVLYSSLAYAQKEAGVGDYYMLTCTNVPAVIVECGFLSNPEEEILLLSPEYREKVCYAILCGIIKYLD